MDRAKKLIGWRQVFLAAAVLAAGTFTLLAGEKPEHGFLGVSVQGLDSAEKEKLGVKIGVEVMSVDKESAAAKAGIKEDDVIQLVNGEKIRNPQDLVDIIAELAPGATVKIGLWREGKTLEVSAELGKREHGKEYDWKSYKLPRIFRSSAYLGVVLQELNPDLAPYFGVKTDEGALIVRVEKDTPAEKAGLKAGDVIVQMGEKAVKDADTVHEILADLKKGDVIAVTVVRHGKKETLKAEPDFSHRQRIMRIFRGCKDKGGNWLENSDLGTDIPELDIELPPLPDMPHIDEALHRVHEKMERVKVKIEKHLEKIGEDFWI
ncbi:MAG: PDZ domain-containing protein [Candidatus Aminicenantes bacterium]|nr:PDZ domain-containing protein [Candidatus Aminicenantes bacterium]